MNNQLLLDNLRCIPDWPIKGVNFRDVTTLFKNPAALKEISDEMYELYKDKGITKIVGVFVDFDGVDARLLGITFLYGLAWKFAWLSAQNDSCAEANSQGGRHDETA